MQRQTVWNHIATPLPPLNYVTINDTGTQQKGSTTWAAHSHTPVAVEVWDDFLDLVTTESRKSHSQVVVEDDFGAQLLACRLKPVTREEDITLNVERLLEVFTGTTPPHGLSGAVVYDQDHRFIGPDPDICVRKHVYDPNEALGQHTSPIGETTRAQLRRNLTRTRTRHYMYACETKPCWKFHFLEDRDSHEAFVKFQVPANYTSEDMKAQKPLPRSWSTDKKKVFHLVRQVYGQMNATSRRYGVIHIYENWFFCKRTAKGMMQISSPIARTDTAPSVFQALKTLTGFQDHELGPSEAHPSSAIAMKPPPPQRNQQQGGKKNSKRKRGGDSKGRASGTEAAAGLENLAQALSLRDCILVDVTDTIQLYETLVDPSVLVKLQQNPSMTHVADEMENEANMYDAIAGNAGLVEFLARFRGYSTHMGVAMTCIEQESDDFDDIGAENLSEELKESAVCGVKALSHAGILHNDLELRNIVRSKADPNRAKIIDLGRAKFSDDEERLSEQVEDAKALLGID
jgi:hypothetical protein